jgi:hypothetical protein
MSASITWRNLGRSSRLVRSSAILVDRQVDVVQVDQQGASLFLLPERTHRQREQAQCAAGLVEIGDRGDFVVEGIEQFGVEGVGGGQHLSGHIRRGAALWQVGVFVEQLCVVAGVGLAITGAMASWSMCLNRRWVTMAGISVSTVGESTRSWRAETLQRFGEALAQEFGFAAEGIGIDARVSTTTTRSLLAANSSSDIKNATVCSASVDCPDSVETALAARRCRAISSSMISVGRSATSASRRPVPGAAFFSSLALASS